MTNLLAARSQMAISLGFHIVFAEIGIAMPLMMVLAELQWARTGAACDHPVASSVPESEYLKAVWMRLS